MLSCRSPHGERGLKFVLVAHSFVDVGSLPSRGAWIEIAVSHSNCAVYGQSLPSRGAWIEIQTAQAVMTQTLQSLPSRGAWIEIALILGNLPGSPVAPLTGSVD